MKKKALVISTIVMVMVLVASLTTATYAWFIVDSRTSIDGFNLSVTSNSVLNIGLRADCNNATYSASDAASLFVSGEVTYGKATDGKLGGTWSGDNGLGPAISHSINFESVSKAVGVTTLTGADISDPAKYVLTGNTKNVFGFNTDTENTSYTGYTSTANIFKSNGDGKTALSGVPELAVANGYTPEGESAVPVPADFAYMWLGVRPTKQVAEGSNKMYIIVQSDGVSLGIAAAVHVAYRLNGSAWQDVDVFDGANVGQGTDSSSVTLSATELTQPVIDAIKANAFLAVDNSGVLKGADCVTLTLTGENEKSNIDQIEFVIYIAGQDADCITNAIKTGSIKIGIFFGAQEDKQ